MKVIFVTWGSMSWLWKWVTSASIWKLIGSSGKRVWMIKMDPYLQVDAGTMSPYEHWEVFVTDDWAEADLDLGNYERFTWENLTTDSNITSGKGGTVWDIESQAFLEASRQMKKDIGKENILYVHVAPLLYLKYSWELKTKLIQHSVIKLREYGLQPDILVCRTEKHINSEIKNKISNFCDVAIENVIEAVDAKSIYQVPELFKSQNLDKIIIKSLWLDTIQADLKSWNTLVERIISPEKEVTIWIIWKYTELEDTYKSISEALIHGWVAHNAKVHLNWINSENLENQDFESILKTHQKNNKLDGILVPWWFWERWVEWKINAVKFARENSVPYLWICLWLQVAVIEFARNMCSMRKKLFQKDIDIDTRSTQIITIHSKKIDLFSPECHQTENSLNL